MANTNTAPKAPTAKKTAAAKKAAAAPTMKATAPTKVAAPKADEVKSYDLDSYKDLKRRGSDALNALMYEARLRKPKATKDQATAVATVDALIKAYSEWVRLVEEAARPLLKE